jgi:hypothetical protein
MSKNNNLKSKQRFRKHFKTVIGTVRQWSLTDRIHVLHMVCPGMRFWVAFLMVVCGCFGYLVRV